MKQHHVPIVLDNIICVRGGRTILNHVSARIEPGEVTGLLGQNGAGKSTLIRTIVGLERTAGTATIGGKKYSAIIHPMRTVGVVLDGPAAHPRRSARTHLTWLALSQGIKKARVDEVLDIVSLRSEAHRNVREFSLGMTQRLSLAAALLGDPDVLILDEPFNGLDPEGIRDLRAALKAWADQGRTVLVSSHLIEEFATVADTIILLNHGSITFHGSLKDFQGDDANLEDAFFTRIDGNGTTHFPDANTQASSRLVEHIH